MLTSINELLSHIKEVEEDTMKLSQESMMGISEFIEKNNLELDDNAAKALQYQDIISQQLSATIDAINSVQKSIHVFENAYESDEQIASESFQKLNNKLAKTLDVARSKREAFSGNLQNADENEIEFF